MTTDQKYLADAEEQLGVSKAQMAALMAIPYDSYKDLANGRRKLRDIHRRLIDMLIGMHAGSMKDAEKFLRIERKDTYLGIKEAHPVGTPGRKAA